MNPKQRGRPRKNYSETIEPSGSAGHLGKNDPRLCPLLECGGESRVLNTKSNVSNGVVQYRICLQCSYRFQTVVIRESEREKVYRSR